MKRFQFRLARVERWRQQRAIEFLREHERAVQIEAEAKTLLGEHEQMERAYLDDLAQKRVEGGVEIEVVIESERYRSALTLRQQTLAERGRIAAAAAARTLERLIGARRELKPLESLRSARLATWQRSAELEAQKQADESHRSRLLLERARMAASERAEGELVRSRDTRGCDGVLPGPDAREVDRHGGAGSTTDLPAGPIESRFLERGDDT